MFERLASFIHRHRRRVLPVAVAGQATNRYVSLRISGTAGSGQVYFTA
jgi:hypothetical protein